MALKTLVAVNNISNLSDARYCAGMGVDIISFCLSEGQPSYTSPAAVKEMAGWVAGVKITGQFVNESTEEINQLVSECGLQLVQLNADYLLDELTEISVPVILRVKINKDTDATELTDFLKLYQQNVHYFLLSSDDFTSIDETNNKFLTSLSEQFPLLLGFGIHKANLLLILENIKPAGIALQGGEEIKPGLKNYDELEEIFEALED